MFLPCFPRSAQLVLLLSAFFGLGLGLPIISARTFQLPHLSQIFLPVGMLQENFDPPGDPVPVGTRGAGSRGVVHEPTFPQT